MLCNLDENLSGVSYNLRLLPGLDLHGLACRMTAIRGTFARSRMCVSLILPHSLHMVSTCVLT